MPNTITFRFGGLALFVHRTEPTHEGIVVLMPRDHSLLNRHRPQVLKSKVGLTIGYLQGTYDFRKSLVAGPGWPDMKRVTAAAHFTKLTDKGYITKSSLSPGEPTPEAASARFILPYAKDIVTEDSVVEVEATYGNNTIPMTDEVAGTVSLVYELKDNVEIQIHDPDDTLVFDARHDWIVELANVQSPKVTSGHYKAGTKIGHVKHYYHLITGGQREPEIKTKKPFDHPPKRRDQVTQELRFEPDFVNPVECIIGTACAEDDPHCSDD